LQSLIVMSHYFVATSNASAEALLEFSST